MQLQILPMLMLAMIVTGGCSSYKTQYASFRPPEGYANLQVLDGISIGGEAYADSDEADWAFGFDIKGAGLLPVQLVLDNKSRGSVEILANQTFLVDDKNGYWSIIPTNIAFLV